MCVCVWERERERELSIFRLLLYLLDNNEFHWFPLRSVCDSISNSANMFEHAIATFSVLNITTKKYAILNH